MAEPSHRMHQGQHLDDLLVQMAMASHGVPSSMPSPVDGEQAMEGQGDRLASDKVLITRRGMAGCEGCTDWADVTLSTDEGDDMSEPSGPFSSQP